MNKEELVDICFSQKYIKKINNKIKLLGNKFKLNVYDFLLIRTMTSIFIFVFCISLFKLGYIIGPIITVCYYFMFNYFVIDKKIKQRQILIESEAIHFFEVLTLSLDTGKNLIESIEVTTKNVNGILSDEFIESLREVSFGKSMTEALNDMQFRIPSENVSNIILALTQANLYGNSIIDNLYQQIDYLREKRKLEVKGRIAKVPVYISVISVLFFIPLLLLIILGPILLKYVG